MNYKKLSLALLTIAAIATGSMEARRHHHPRIGFSVNFSVPTQPVQMAPHYTNMNGFQYYWNGQQWFVWGGNQWLAWNGAQWMPTSYASYNCFRVRPQVSLGFGGRHGGFSFSF